MANKVSKRQVERIQDYQTVFSSVQGKRVLNDMMQTHYVMASTFSEQPGVSALREGERNAVLRILNILSIDVNQLRERIEQNEKIRDDETIV